MNQLLRYNKNMVKSKKTTKYKIKKIPLTDDQLAASRMLIKEELETNPDIFILPDSKRSVDDIANFLIKVREWGNP